VHLTIGETAFLAPAGVILGAVVSYFAVRKTAKDNVAGQKLTIEANRLMAQAEREEAIARERREHKREAYVRLIGLLGQLNKARRTLLVELEEVMYRAHRNIADFGLTESYKEVAEAYTGFWDEAIQIARAYGSREVADSVRYLGDHRPSIAAYHLKGRGAHIHASNVLYRDATGKTFKKRITVSKYDDNTEAISAFYEECEESARILGEATDYCLGQMRYELQIDENAPTRFETSVTRINPLGGKSNA
jgi:hypothetical protein